jgi:septum formation protein
VLASGSPRRQELVSLLGLPWRVAPQEVDEENYVVGDPTLTSLSVALAKARAAAGGLSRCEIVLSADTLVLLDGQLLGKPAGPAEARDMLWALRARPHGVLTGVALRDSDGYEWGAVVSTRVHMRAYALDEIDAYIARGEPFDKAGAYAIQDRPFHPVERIEGCYLNVVGLPLCAIARGLETMGALATPEPQASFVPPCPYCVKGGPLVQIT